MNDYVTATEFIEVFEILLPFIFFGFFVSLLLVVWVLFRGLIYLFYRLGMPINKEDVGVFMQISKSELNLIIESLNQIYLADNPETDDFKSRRELSEDQFDTMVLTLKEKITFVRNSPNDVFYLESDQ